MTTILIIRPEGSHTRAPLPGYTVIETSPKQLSFRLRNGASILADLDIGAVILEDMRFDELDGHTRHSIREGIRDGVSCPIVTRWTSPQTGNSL